MIHILQFFYRKSFKRVYWTCLNIANAISEHAGYFKRVPWTYLGTVILFLILKHVQNTCENAWTCSEKVLKRVQWSSCKLWSILPDEDFISILRWLGKRNISKHSFNIEDDKKKVKTSRVRVPLIGTFSENTGLKCRQFFYILRNRWISETEKH